MKTKKTLRLFATLAMLSTGFNHNLAAHTAPADTMLHHFLRKAAAYSIRTPQEKVYLHLDNNGYFKEETIWFKAYVVQAASLYPTNLSRVLYVDLLNNEGQLVEQKKLHIYNGTAHGDFSLQNLPNGGFYEIRAYTREMLNWDECCIFSRVFPVFEQPREAGNFEKLELFRPMADYELPSQRPKAKKIKNDFALNFYPEGGARVKGVDNRIAFQLTNQQGMPTEAECKLYDNAGTLITTFAPVHEGRGRFTLPASATEGGYVTISENGKEKQRFALPEAETGRCALAMAGVDADTISLQLQGGAGFEEQTAGVYVSCRGAACYFATADIGKTATVVQIPRRVLHPGVNQITIYNRQGMILAERLLFQYPDKANQVTMQVKQNAQVYPAASPIALEFYLRDAQNKPVTGSFSLSVRDAQGEAVAPGMDLCTDLLLCSDLRGYVSRPDFYFQKDDYAHREALDLLLSIQGWKRYDWNEMAEIKPFVLKHPIEEGLVLDGSVYIGKEPVPGAQLDLYMFTLAGASMKGRAVADKEGKFAFMPQAYIGDWIARITTRIDEKPKNLKVRLNNTYQPAIRTYEPTETVLYEPREPLALTKPESISLFNWTDTLPKGTIVKNLGEVKVTARRYKGHVGNRYSYGGGEATGKKYANLYYNLRQATEECWNKGEETPLVWDWLAENNKKFRYEMNDSKEGISYEFYYKERPVVLFLDNVEYEQDRLGSPSFFIEELKSVMILDNTLNVVRHMTNVTRKSQFAASGKDEVCIMLYSDENAFYFRQNRGKQPLRLHGYALSQTFTAPNYRLMELPAQGDFRRTLYWNPNVATDEKGKASAAFFGNSRDELMLHISAQGILQKGQMLNYEQ